MPKNLQPCVCVCACVCMRERDCVSVWEREIVSVCVCVCEREREREREREWETRLQVTFMSRNKCQSTRISILKNMWKFFFAMAGINFSQASQFLTRLVANGKRKMPIAILAILWLLFYNYDARF